MLDRHPLLSPGEKNIVAALRKYEDEFTPEVGAAVGRLLSATLSPMPIKAEPKDAKEALQIITTVVLPVRREKRLALTKKEEAEAEELAQAARAAMEAANAAKGAARKAKRKAIGAREGRAAMERVVETTTRVVFR